MHTRKSRRNSPLLEPQTLEEVERRAREARRAAGASGSSRVSSPQQSSSESSDSEESTHPSTHSEMGDEAARTVDSYYRPGDYTDTSPIVFATENAGNNNNNPRRFEARPQLIAILPIFRGSINEEPYEHLNEFREICTTNQVNGFTQDEICLRLFSYSLKDKAKRWFLGLRPQSITTWAEMKKKFLEEFYPISKTSDVRNQIKTFRQLPNELFHEAFERFKELLRSCPHHEVPAWEQVKSFYDGLDTSNRQLLLAASGGAFMGRSSEDELAFFEQLSKGSKTQASVERKSSQSASVHAVSNSPGFERDIRSNISELNRKFDQLMARNSGGGGSSFSNVSQVQEVCMSCGDPSHFADFCPVWTPPLVEEQVNEVQGRKYDPYSNTYNPGWRDHPNFKWGGDNQNQASGSNANQNRNPPQAFNNQL